MPRILRSFVVIVCMAITPVLTAALVYWIEDKTDFSLYRFTFWFVAPVGAVLCGVAGASGAFFSSRVLNARPGSHFLVLAAADSLLMFFALNWMEYSFGIVQGVHISDEIPFTTFLSLMLSHASVDTFGQTTSIGWGGYLYALLDGLGFFVVAAGVLASLSALLYCDECNLHFEGKGAQTRYFQWEDEAKTAIAAALLQIKESGFQRGVATHAALGTAARTDMTEYLSRLSLYRCKGCAVEQFELEGQQKEGERWKQMRGLKFVLLNKVQAKAVGVLASAEMKSES